MQACRRSVWAEGQQSSLRRKADLFDWAHDLKHVEEHLLGDDPHAQLPRPVGLAGLGVRVGGDDQALSWR
jgi:hypothetical protein